MKTLILIPFAAALFIPAATLGQDSAKRDAVTHANVSSKQASTKVRTLSGKVGDDGRTITTARNDLWTVTNPELLKGHAGQQVKVKCQISSDSEENRIQILSVKIIPSEVKFTANPSDAAFRR
jgi:hypothetical protein